MDSTKYEKKFDLNIYTICLKCRFTNRELFSISYTRFHLTKTVAYYKKNQFTLNR